MTTNEIKKAATPTLAADLITANVEIERLMEALGVASANIYNVLIGLSSGSTKVQAARDLNETRNNIRKALDVKL
jgi:hypothetical protein